MDTATPWIAIVDDEESIRRALLRLFDSVGIEAKAYASGANLINTMGANWPCCVVLDMHMPGIDGHQVQARLAQLAPQVRVIAITGQHSAEVKNRVLHYPNAIYLNKPMPERLLLEAVGAALAAWFELNQPEEQA